MISIVWAPNKNVPWWLRAASRALSWPLVNWPIRGTFLGMCGHIGYLRNHNKTPQAMQVVLSILTNPQSKIFKSHPYRWWFFMRIGLTMAQEELVRGDLSAEDYMVELYELACTREAKGHDAAFCHIVYALWMFQQGQLQVALICATQATRACPEWSYTHYLLGWLELFDPNADPYPHLAAAVQQDFGMLNRIKSDPVCQQFPELLQRLQKERIVKRA